MKLVVVDIQPEYEDNATFDIGDMLRSAAEEYDSVLFLFNGEDTLGMISESALKNYYFELAFIPLIMANLNKIKLK